MKRPSNQSKSLWKKSLSNECGANIVAEMKQHLALKNSRLCHIVLSYTCLKVSSWQTDGYASRQEGMHAHTHTHTHRQADKSITTTPTR